MYIIRVIQLVFSMNTRETTNSRENSVLGKMQLATNRCNNMDRKLYLFLRYLSCISWKYVDATYLVNSQKTREKSKRTPNFLRGELLGTIKVSSSGENKDTGLVAYERYKKRREIKSPWTRKGEKKCVLHNLNIFMNWTPICM